MYNIVLYNKEHEEIARLNNVIYRVAMFMANLLKEEGKEFKMILVDSFGKEIKTK